MQLPHYNKNKSKKKKLKICHETGCGKEFWGHPIAKYCELHRDIRNRVRRRRQYDAVDKDNMIFNHRFSEVTGIEFQCALPGCGKKFIIRVFPKQVIYPKYCEEHRVSYKRDLFDRNRKVVQNGSA